MTETYTAEDKTTPAVCYALYLIAFATGITAIIGLVIAYSQRSTAGPANESHYTFLIRTFWIGLLLMVAGGVVFGVGMILSVILIGFPIMGLAWLIWAGASVWYAVRCIVGLVHLSRGEGYPRPYAALA
ncbi:MAG: hypothetical protein DI570_13160 [Phenylobacterium zucineum]|nr:MAG: hypothetical protein DI570_13160 [Phenylobacterium zucineum]